MTIVIIWIACGLFNLIFYLYQCFKDSEIRVSDIVFSIILTFIGIVGTVFIICFLLTDLDTDKVVWKSKKDDE